MKKILTLLLVLTATGRLTAQPVGFEKAKKIAEHYIAINEPQMANLTVNDLPQTVYTDDYCTPIMYVFNIDDTGFIIAGANKSFSPIVGYSFNGSFDSERLPDNLKAWLNGYVEDVVAVKNSQTKSSNILAAQNEFQAEWKALENSDASYYAAKGGKAVEALVETRWDQGAGYNNYCPEYNGGHSVTGCVATAMAQIIRYHRYPNVGYHHSSYYHPVYGNLQADFDSTFYDYTKMPVSVNAYSNSAYQHAVSQLCYHCGIAVKMNYQNPSHTSGSGAHSENVPEAIKHFGYLDSYYKAKTPDSDLWDSLLRHDLDLNRPVYYSGSDNEGGHAFVCDGYRNNNKYHFNFGWSGYGDGFYSLTSVNGYSSSQAAVFNIYPCNMGPMQDTLYIAADGTGTGSGWNSAHSNLNNAMKICGMYKRGQIWVKQGTYLGNTESEYAFTIPNGVAVYGGFAGNETSLGERNLQENITILSGDGKRGVLYSPTNTIDSRIYDLTFANGLAENGSAAYIANAIRVERCVFANSQATGDNGAAVYSNQGNLYCCIFENNIGGAADLNNCSLKNSLVAHTDGYGIRSQNSTIDGCDIVCNSGTGIVNLSGTKIRNCILWHNDSSLADNNISRITFSAIEGFEGVDSNSNIGLSHLNRPNEGIGPFFVAPDTTIGPANTLGDWRLSNLSPLVNAGDTNRSGSYTHDLADGNRFRSGRVDIGCYEQDPYVGMETPAETQPFCIYPNPANNFISIESTPGNVDIYDAMGRRVMQTLTNGKISIDISHLSNGIYLIRTNDATRKFIKK
jgi:hypothetical protein